MTSCIKINAMWSFRSHRNSARNIGTGKPGKVMATINAINATTAQLSWAYLNGVLREYNMNILLENAGNMAVASIPQIDITNRYWYNEMLNYKYYMLPGVLGILVTAIGFLLAGLNLVKEKEVGTIEQINVTPVRKYHFIIAKMVPFLIIGLVDLSLGLIIGKIIFNIPFEGSSGSALSMALQYSWLLFWGLHFLSQLFLRLSSNICLLHSSS